MNYVWHYPVKQFIADFIKSKWGISPKIMHFAIASYLSCLAVLIVRPISIPYLFIVDMHDKTTHKIKLKIDRLNLGFFKPYLTISCKKKVAVGRYNKIIIYNESGNKVDEFTEDIYPTIFAVTFNKQGTCLGFTSEHP